MLMHKAYHATDWVKLGPSSAFLGAVLVQTPANLWKSMSTVDLFWDLCFDVWNHIWMVSRDVGMQHGKIQMPGSPIWHMCCETSGTVCSDPIKICGGFGEKNMLCFTLTPCGYFPKCDPCIKNLYYSAIILIYIIYIYDHGVPQLTNFTNRLTVISGWNFPDAGQMGYLARLASKGRAGSFEAYRLQLPDLVDGYCLHLALACCVQGNYLSTWWQSIWLWVKHGYR